MNLEEKIKQMLNKADANLQEANVDGTKLEGERQDIDGPEAGKKAAAAAKKTKFPGNDKNVEMKQMKQGADDEQIEELGAEEDGKNASAKAKYAGGLSAKGGAEGAAPNFNTVADIVKAVLQANSKGNIDGVRLESLELEALENYLVSEAAEEQLDELSKQTLARYAQSARDEADDAEDYARFHRDIASDKTVDPQERKNRLQAARDEEKYADKRKAGAKKALSKIAKEDLDLTPIFGDAELSEDFKDKATSMFEAVVQARVNHEFEALQEQYEAELAEEVAEIKSELIEKVDVFLDNVVEAWVAENQLAIESGLRTEIAEDFMTGLKNLFKESYIEIPEDKYDVLADLEEQVAQLKTQVEEQASIVESVASENDSLKKEKVFAEVSEGLADTEADKFKQLIEGVEYGSEELFREKLSVIKENYFPKTVKVSAERVLEEQATGNGEFNAPSQVEKYAKAMSRYIAK